MNGSAASIQVFLYSPEARPSCSQYLATTAGSKRAGMSPVEPHAPTRKRAFACSRKSSPSRGTGTLAVEVVKDADDAGGATAEPPAASGGALLPSGVGVALGGAP